VAEFLDSFDVERSALLGALGHVEEVWARFQERRALEVEGASASDSLIASELDLVRGDLSATEFTVGIFGLIKRGKSTLLNALIGREVSSMHVTPETAVPVYVSYGEASQATVHFADGNIKHVAVEDVHHFTSQKANPGNQLGVTFVEQQVPVGFLRNGTRLIDTPGLDDAEADEVYTERTLQELDIVDAGVVLFLSPPTVSQTEMKFLEQVVAKDLKKTFLVCNMYPQHFHDPETRNAVLDYVGRRIVEASQRAGRFGQVVVYPVCALEAWQARQNDDIDLWKRSGADRLLRDLENELSESAGKLVLREAADRIEKATEMAKAEVRVRQQLLEDPQQLAEFRSQLDANIFDLERRFDEAVANAFTEVAPLKMRIRGLVLQPFTRAKNDLEELDSPQELEAFASRFRRQLEVAGEMASRQFGEGFEHLVDGLQEQLEQRFHAVMSDLTPTVPQVRLASNALLATPDQVQELQNAQARTRSASRTSALVGGLAGGGGALAVAGATFLGPIGLLGGALVGWKLSNLVAGQRNIAKARTAVHDRLDEIAAELLRDVDRQVGGAVESVRSAVERRRRLFAADLYQQFEVVSRISEDPGQLAAYKRDAHRFIQAFDACALKARQAAGTLEDPRPALAAV
jgi:GTPase SAR1 family protein